MPRTSWSRPEPGRPRRAVAAGATLAALAAIAATGPAASALGVPSSVSAATDAAASAVLADGEYTQRFLELYDKIHDPANGYFSPQGIPYHSRETLMVEAPDHGHETTSEAYSFWLWLETSYGQVTGDWEPFNHAWDTLERYMIPTRENQPTNAAYDPGAPATYAPEYNHPSQYPGELSSSVPVGSDPIGAELRSTYGTSDIYGMHWLADVDNVYGFGAAPGSSTLLGPDHEGTSYINTFQRGPQESVWETIPQPSIDDFTYGGENGFLDLFTGDSSYAKQWKYTNAPDADARAVEAAYWASKFAAEQGQPQAVAATLDKASKMGDYLRYALFDKYFKTPGCESESCAAGSGRDSAHYLLSWYYAWGGALDTSSPWAWRIGSSHAHFGYQNPMAAWALSTDPDLAPASPTASDDWAKSLDRQLELFRWLQSPEGGIAGGATNSWDGHYADRPDDVATFYGMAYQEAPVYHDPPSNSWMGMQGWGMERVAQLYEETGDERAEEILDDWVPWVIDHITVTDSTWEIPSNLAWSGQPDDWDAANPGDNAGLSVEVTGYGQDVGVAGALARTLMYYAAGGESATHAQAQQVAHDLLGAIWTQDSDTYGVATTETRADYDRFDDVLTTAGGDGVYVPDGWSGTMPNGDVIEPGVSFLDIRSFYQNDPDWAKVQAQLDGGPDAEFTYHRFWAQTAIATALADYDRLFGDGGGGEPGPVDTVAPSAPTGLSAGTATATSVPVTWTASTDDVRVTGYTVLVDGTAVGTASGTTYTITGLSPDTSYGVTVTARDAAGNVSEASAPLTVTTAADGGTEPQPGTCTATYTTVNSWSGGYQGEVVVKAGTSAIPTWKVTAPAGLTTSNVWGGTLASGTFTPEAWNGSLAAGATTTVGFIGTGTPPANGTLTCE
ncbi:glycoside hydrolase family 48 [Xylanimonas cellulosilytica DSM 15894]|uniref:Glycoside hydrolase family 48 n=1 Tax=Xylanimonas cellulosilytica (strain DSM 15894 / JCM 12276 / CECT 5975 / KCTC 9989 / LMG 20990 / NBRC 107835 / XIL07) TaxID=446471 RepID=D1BZN0_XYLCX|nr:glycoside hydrolase family 48 protein [Xylanimonas cellulosilytica]ACZ30184.1 glycoside hydrolase family 48 [Xylanimonas cellulosilytica DSM 15894]